MEQNASSAVTLDEFLATISAGTGDDLLIRGPAMSGKQTVAYRAFVAAADDAVPICVTTTDRSDRVRATFDAAGGDGDRLVVVDAVSRQSGIEDRTQPRTRYAASPADLTGIGMALTSVLENLNRQPVVLVDSISSLLLYSELNLVFRFLHLLTGRIEAAGGRTIQLLNTDSHSSQELASVAQLFELLVDVRFDDSSRTVRLRGDVGTQTEWRPLVFDDEVDQ